MGRVTPNSKPAAEFTLRPAAKSTAAVAIAAWDDSLGASSATRSAARIAAQSLDGKLMRKHTPARPLLALTECSAVGYSWTVRTRLSSPRFVPELPHQIRRDLPTIRGRRSQVVDWRNLALQDL